MKFIINLVKTTKKSSAGRAKSLQKHREKIFQSNSMISLLKLNSPERHLLKCLVKELKLPHSNNSLPIGKHQMLLIHSKKFKLVGDSPKASLVSSFLLFFNKYSYFCFFKLHVFKIRTMILWGLRTLTVSLVRLVHYGVPKVIYR